MEKDFQLDNLLLDSNNTIAPKNILHNPKFQEFPCHNGNITDLSWNCEGSYLASVAMDKTCKIFLLELSGNLKLIQSIPLPRSAVQVKWCPVERNRFVICGEDISIDIWEVHSSHASSKLSSNGENLFISWSPNAKYLSVVNKRNILSVFDVETCQLLNELRFPHEINEMHWGINSDLLLVASGIGGIEVITFKNNILSNSYQFKAHTSNCQSIKVHKSIMALDGSDFQISLWDLEEMISYACIQTDTDILAMALSNDGAYIAVSLDSSGILLFDTSNGKQVGKVGSKNKYLNLAWHPSRNFIAVSVLRNLYLISFVIKDDK